ncbi:type IV pilus modification PilV family protein [Eshraghiella crossota]|uniref:type IV pilus modification PilV family protein n=1 Tax=Eshraghiella crossota TaxID=45851 RepID=UPI003FEF54AD
MMRHPRKAGKQNMGFSLVEVLVTLALISVLSIPLIQTFVNSARVNGKAKSMQNATDIAQSISEYFGAMPLDALKTAYKGKYTSMSDGRIVFTNIGDGINKDSDGVDYYKGSDTEKFYVSVIVDPTGYSKADKTGMNDYIRPGINNLNENSSITCRSKLEQYDTNIVNTFKEKGVNVDDKSKIVKKSVFTIYENKSTVYADKVEYKYNLDITYTYNNKNIEYKNIELGIGTVDKAGIAAPNLYIIYTPVLGMYGNENVAKDEITVKYRPDSEKADWEKPVNVYLVEQTANFESKEDTKDTKVSLDKNNIKIECYNNSGECDKLGFYTNVAGWTGANSSLTEGGSSINKLYNVSVYIWKDKTDGMTIKDKTLRIADDYFTKVDSVKEG